MPFLPGNTLWKLAKNPGRPRKYSSKEELWNKCVEYFEYCEENPLYEMKLFNVNGNIEEALVAKPRAMTLEGIRIVLGIDKSTWAEWGKEDHDFSAIIRHAEEIIREQKLSGAAANIFNASIVARDLQLKDSSDVTHNAGDGVNFNLSFGAKDGD